MHFMYSPTLLVDDIISFMITMRLIFVLRIPQLSWGVLSGGGTMSSLRGRHNVFSPGAASCRGWTTQDGDLCLFVFVSVFVLV